MLSRYALKMLNQSAEGKRPTHLEIWHFDDLTIRECQRCIPDNLCARRLISVCHDFSLVLATILLLCCAALLCFPGDYVPSTSVQEFEFNAFNNSCDNACSYVRRSLLCVVFVSSTEANDDTLRFSREM